MKVKCLPVLLILLLAFAPSASIGQEESNPTFRVAVDLVQLNVAVTDKDGNYVTGLRPEDFQVSEDNIAEKLSTFGEGDEPTRRLDLAQSASKEEAPAVVETKVESPTVELSAGGIIVKRPDDLGTLVAGASVFILFDTSNYMYRGFAFAQDAIADFVRSLEGPDRVAFYSYSRNVTRAALLTADRNQVLRGVRTTVAGDNAALYNALLLALKDAGRYTGRKIMVVFSNGPDNASVVAPEDITELAQLQGIPIYMISTREAKREPVSTAVFERMSLATGGKAYFAKDWTEQQKAFASIREDLAHLYSLSYYPQPNPNRGWRAIKVKLVGDRLKSYRVRTRNGYRPEPPRASAEISVEIPQGH